MVNIIPRSKKKFGMLLVLPAMIILGFVYVYPLLHNLDVSMMQWDLTGQLPKKFVGLANFEYYASSEVILTVLKNTLLFVFISVPLELGLGLLLAVALQNVNKGRGKLLSILVLPMLVAPITVGLIWKWMYAYNWGSLNAILGILGINAVNWLGNQAIALYSIVLADMWAMTPFMMLFCYSGLMMIPEERYEAADIDGASSFQKFRHVTVPSIKGILLIGLMIRMIDAFTKLFDVVYIMTGGGPAYSTMVLPMYIYKVGFSFFRMGRASALSIIALIITIIMISILRKGVQK